MAPEKLHRLEMIQKRVVDGKAYAFALFAALFTFRLINSLSIKTFFQPDEYFQSLEPAWRNAFGDNSGAWITWEWREHLRSSIHPLLFAGIYKMAHYVANSVELDTHTRANILIAAPKFLQAFFAATTDFYTFRLACKVYGGESPASAAALALTVFSPWQWFCSVRTLSNSLETSLTVVAMSFWPWSWFLGQDELAQSDSHTTEDRVKGKETGDKSKVATATQVRKHKSQLSSSDTSKGLDLSLILAASACILRPTNIMIWATISISLIIRYGNYTKAVVLVKAAILNGSAMLVASVAMDRAYYQQLVFPPLRFLYFNLVQSLAVFYGNNRRDYYFTEGLPLLLLTALPFTAVGIWQSLRTGNDQSRYKGYEERQILFVLGLSVTTYVLSLSLISHKEVRFLYPVLPCLHNLAAKPMARFFDSYTSPVKKLRLGILLVGIAVNVSIAVYVSFVHQRGVIDVMHFLRSQHEAKLASTNGNAPFDTTPRTTVGFFMPCHSTPWRSHLVHPGIDAWALSCEPPLDIPLDQRQAYLDEADVFYADPARWLDENMEDRHRIRDGENHELGNGKDGRRKWPEYVVGFQQLESVMKTALEPLKHEECWRGFNSHWHDDWRRQGDVVVWCVRP